MKLPNDINWVIEKLKESGLRPTRQRTRLAEIIWANGHRHMTAESLIGECQANNYKVSLATVYNALHTFTEIGLLKEIILDSGKSHFDTNTESHCHFFYEECGTIEDVYCNDLTLPTPPVGYIIKDVEVIISLRKA